MKRVVQIALVLLLALVLVWLFRPAPIDAVAWEPPPAPALEGPWQPNERLEQAKLLGQGQLHGPEATAVDGQGRVYAGTSDGWVQRLNGDGAVEPWVETGGRPLGMAFDHRGYLIVADAWKGLLAISPEGQIEVLATGAEGVPFAFTDDLDIAADGTIYFSDASDRFHQPDYKLDLLEGRPHGRLLKYEPATGETTVLAAGLHFANGVAVDPEEAFVLVNETWRYRITRFWLDEAGVTGTEVFADNLPGFPDNLSRDAEGRYWVALPTLRNATVDAVHPHPWLKELLTRLPDGLQPQPREYGLIAVFNPEGEILASFHDTDGDHLQEITSVEPAGDYLYLGSLHNDRIGRLSLADLRQYFP